MTAKPNTVIMTLVFFSLFFTVRGSFAAESDEMVSRSAKPNRLIHEKSPYLLQHAYNPVDWYPWGDAAFEKARREDKPILLSIGYSTCHWCHVMEKESFSNPKIALVMNTFFVCIKVDREERPDLDKIYITAVDAIAGSAGWPLNVFLTTDLKPFYGGTYFPPVPKFGLPAWPELLKRIAGAWQNPEQRARIMASGQTLSENLTRYFSWSATEVSLNPALLDKAQQTYSTAYDERYGGFGQAPKFPSPSIQNFLMAFYYFAKKDDRRLQRGQRAFMMNTSTLQAMAKGGIYDHIGGGFHRYSTDAKWHIPHFEKMLYDNAQLLVNYLDAFLISRDDFFARVAREIADYVIRDMTHPAGGFYSAEDADSLPAGSKDSPKDHSANQKAEGAFYVWGQKEINAILDPSLGRLFAYRYGVLPDGNVESDPHGEFNGKNILYLAHTLDETAQEFGIPNREVLQLLAAARTRILAVRSKRSRPYLDDKILTSWNGLMIGALSRAYQVLDDERYLSAAVKSAKFIQKHLYDPKSKQLFRRWRRSESKIPGMASDYAFLIQGLIDLYEADFNPAWLDWAMELADEQIRLFYDREHGGFFMTRAGHDKNLIMRVKEASDSVIPSAGSMAVLNFLRLSRYTDKSQYAPIAEKTMKTVLARIQEHPTSAPKMLTALIVSLSKPIEVIIAGDRDREDTRRLLNTAHSFYNPAKMVLLVDNAATRKMLAANLPFMAFIKTVNGKAAAYVCTDRSCSLPVTDPGALAEMLESAPQKSGNTRSPAKAVPLSTGP
jgi:uncharacterized protein YyaL (SSP411 family)